MAECRYSSTILDLGTTLNFVNHAGNNFRVTKFMICNNIHIQASMQLHEKNVGLKTSITDAQSPAFLL
jgi:hypothetical protein